MADKLTDLIAAAVARAAADPGAAPLFGSKAEPGLFPATAAARAAAKRCVEDGLLEIVRGQPPREYAAATPLGLKFLAERACPKRVLEDLVRAVEGQRARADDLTASAARMAAAVESLAEALDAVLPKVAAARFHTPPGDEPTYLPRDPGGRTPMTATATRPATDLAAAIRTHLADWAASAGVSADCPLPELFRALSTREPEPTVGQFHDALRALVAARKVYLHPWTGPLYALPEPPLALLVGHEVAYYASLNQG